MLIKEKNLNVISYYKSDICKLKFYSYLVDELFSRGLDLDMKFKSLGSRDNTIIWPVDTTIHYKPKVDSSEVKYRKSEELYFYFIEVNSSFNTFYDIFEKKNNSKPIIKNVLEYGVFRNPDKIKQLLDLKFAKVNKDRWFEWQRSRRKRRN
jgi:hypothetical protein